MNADTINWDAVEQELRQSYRKPKDIRDLIQQTDQALPKPRTNRYLPPYNKNIKVPYPKQQSFLADDCMEMLYGGAAGGGKSASLLLAALQYADVPGYSALLMRKTFAELDKPAALMDLAQEWLRGTGAQWNSMRKRFTFPTGGNPAVLSFGFCETDNDKWQYQSAAYQFIGIDEVTEWQYESTYRFMFSRLRRLKGSQVPLRMRSGSNPIGIGAGWVKNRFVVATGSDGQTASAGVFESKELDTKYVRKFLPARLTDNVYLDQAAYRASLSALDAYLVQALEAGNWDVKPPGKMFQRSWFKRFIYEKPVDIISCRFWDFAATPEDAGGNPSWTCGVRLGYRDGIYYLMDVKRARVDPEGAERLVKVTAEEDGPYCDIVLEEEGGSAGKAVTAHYIKLLPHRTVIGWHPTGPKPARAKGIAGQCGANNVVVVVPPPSAPQWMEPFFDELEQFPPETDRIKTDQVDAFSGAYIYLSQQALLDYESITMTGERPRPDW